ncbi:MAG: mycothiol transferase [Curtobacterium sp.]
MTELQRVLLSTLREQRRRVLSTLDGLPEPALTRSAVPSGWSPLGMVRHLTFDVERFWFRGVVSGEELDLPTDDEVWHPMPWPGARHVIAEYEAAAAHTHHVIETTPLDALPPARALSLYPWAPNRSLLETVVHVITETATHAGHLDVGRELVDGHQHLVLTEFGERR